MNPRLQILIIFIFFCVHNLDAQNQANIWFFGDRAGLNFINEEVRPLYAGQISANPSEVEGTSVISDDDGKLLFYSDGETVWNKNHEVMPNGVGLLGHKSSTHAAFIVPLPLSNRYFYLFTTDSWFHTGLEYGLRFSVIDLCLDDDLGDVMPDQKNVLLQELMTEKVAVVRHSNGVDYWIVTHKYLSDAFYAYRLSPEGLDINNPVISKTGRVHEVFPDSNDLGAAIGQMKISPDGKKLALCMTNTFPNVFELFDFDTDLGVVSNPIDFTNLIEDKFNLTYVIYGVEFSPDNKKLYLAFFDKIFQMDLSDENGGANEIINSTIQVGAMADYTGFYGMQLAPNNKIYVSNYNDMALSTIENPNALGVDCNFMFGSQDLAGRTASYSFPSFIAGFDYSNTKNEECPRDCAGVLEGNSIVDLCGECLLPDDLNFNQSCADCNGTPNGDYIVDLCGECLPQNDPTLNQSCADCNGTPNGDHIVDECGVCLPQSDPTFNQSCADCNGEPNGDFILDDCGDCLLPGDPVFNLCLDCNNTPNGDYIVDDCGACLPQNDPTFNQSCADCNGEPNGNFVLDDCGECLSPDDLNFNQCLDCNNMPNGDHIVDDCGECLPLGDPTFNQACADCNGEANGNFVLDDCGECLPPDDPLFNLSCLNAKIFIPNAFSPNEDRINDLFKVHTNGTLPTIIKNYVIYNRFGQKVYFAQNFNINDDNLWWDGRFKNIKQPLGVFTYYIEVEILNEPIQKFKGNVTLVR